MKQYCLQCQKMMIRYIPEKHILPSLWLCPQCGLVAIPNSQTGQTDLHRLMHVPSEVKALLKV